TMRLGGQQCKLLEGTRARDVYGRDTIVERHRHRYEFNNNYREPLTSRGLVISGTSMDDMLVEVIELRDHPWFIGVQFHPEFTSRPFDCHPLFKGFVRAAVQRRAGSSEGVLLRAGGAER